jgi:regulator of sirC expression with transglutaminase-like and TPR domain
MLTNLRLLFGLLWQPLASIRSLRDRAPVGFAVGAALLMSWIYSLVVAAMSVLAQAGVRPQMAASASIRTGLLLGNITRSLMTAVMIVLFVAVIYVPFVILIANLFERRASFSLVVREEFAPMASCALMSLAASFLAAIVPAIVVGWQSAQFRSDAVTGFFVLVIVIPLPVFAWMMTLTIGTVFHLGQASQYHWIAAIGTVLISFLSFIILPLFIDATSFICGSPFLLLLLFFLLRDRVDDFMRSQRSRQSFRQNLQAATLNPADASAHYNLGLLYQQRGELDAAIGSFQRAIEIDKNETDAHYQLGRIARWQNRLSEAIQHFEQVIRQDATHSQYEIWRETALAYYSAKQYSDALEMFDKFSQHRPSDAQGRYWRGMTLHNLGRTAEAIEEMQTCIESVKTAPAYKYRTERQWLHLAQSFLREQQS